MSPPLVRYFCRKKETEANYVNREPPTNTWSKGFQPVRDYAKTNLARTHWSDDNSGDGLPENFGEQTFEGEGAGFDGMYRLMNRAVRRTEKGRFDFTSLWVEEEEEKTIKIPSWVRGCSRLSPEAMKALAALPTNLASEPPVKYLSGIGCEFASLSFFLLLLFFLGYSSTVSANDQGKSVLEAINHPRQNTLKLLPPFLTFAGTLYHYVHNCADISDTDERIDAAFRLTLKVASGTITPWTYIATKGSAFPLHQEDALLPSANQHLIGAPRVWLNLMCSSLLRLQGMVYGAFYG